jgi:hypothetical protein
MKRLTAAAPAIAAMLWCACPLLSAAEKTPRQSADQRVIRKAPKSTKRAAATSPDVIAEVLGKSFTVDAGGSKTFDAVSDFSGTETVAISVKAVSGSDIANQGFQIWVYWALPDVDFWSANDVIVGDQFNFYIQGGSVLPVYGPELRLVVQNATNQPMNFDQLTVYAVRKIALPVATPAEP